MQNIDQCPKWVSKYPRMVPSHMRCDLVGWSCMRIMTVAQSWTKMEIKHFLLNCSSEKLNIPIFRLKYHQMPGFAWPASYMGVSGEPQMTSWSRFYSSLGVTKFFLPLFVHFKGKYNTSKEMSWKLLVSLVAVTPLKMLHFYWEFE